MSDKDIRHWSPTPERREETTKPAQIPLLDEVVDEEELPAPPPRKRRPRRPATDPGPEPETGDLFAAPEQDWQPGSTPAATGPDWPPVGEYDTELSDWQDDPATEAHFHGAVQSAPQPPDEPDPTPGPHRDDDARQALRDRAGQMVDHLVAELSPAILDRLRAELTEQLTSVLEDLDTGRDHQDNRPVPDDRDDGDDSPSSG